MYERGKETLLSNHSVKKTFEDLILSLILAIWKVIVHTKKEWIEEF